MTYKELLADVRRLFRRIRTERKKALQTKRKDLKNLYELEEKKLKSLTKTKNAFSLGNGKKKADLENILEELETFIKNPKTTENSRKKAEQQRLNDFMNDWQLTENEANNFFDLMNSDEMRELIELKLFSSDQVMELSRESSSARKVISRLANLTLEEKQKMKEKTPIERHEWLVNFIKKSKG